MYRTRMGTWIVVIALCLWLPAGSSGQESQPPQESDLVKSHGHVIRLLDRDRDRQIDADELAAGQELASLLLMLSFHDCDRDQDGQIKPPELAAAIAGAREELAQVDAETETHAEDELARAVSLDVLLGQLAADERYADEITALREAIEDVDDDEAVITYITGHPKLYPRLGPVVRVWGRHYPVRPELRRHFWRRPPHRPAYLKPPKPIKPHPKARPKPSPKPKPKPRPRPKPRRPGP